MRKCLDCNNYVDNWKSRCGACFKKDKNKKISKKCNDCEKYFVGEPWKYVCITCFKETINPSKLEIKKAYNFTD